MRYELKRKITTKFFAESFNGINNMIQYFNGDICNVSVDEKCRIEKLDNLFVGCFSSHASCNFDISGLKFVDFEDNYVKFLYEDSGSFIHSIFIFTIGHMSYEIEQFMLENGYID